MKQPRRVIVWRITEACNLGCHFCAYSVDNTFERKAASEDEVLRVGRLLGEYSKQQQRPVLVGWLGGEPFLWKPLGRLSRTFAKEFGLQVSATTNGLALRAPAMRQLLVECFEEIVVSVDGLGPVHDECRGRAGLFDDLQRDVGLLVKEKQASGSRLHIQVNTILMRSNIHAFEELCVTLADWGVSTVTFNQLGGKDRPSFYPDNRITPRQWTDFVAQLPDVRARLQKVGLSVLGGAGYLRRIDSSSSGVRLPVVDCNPGQWFWAISETGLISPCGSTVEDYGVPTSALNTAQDVDGVETLFRTKRAERSSRACADCLSTQVWGKFERVST